jgi:hypothetical protein
MPKRRKISPVVKLKVLPAGQGEKDGKAGGTKAAEKDPPAKKPRTIVIEATVKVKVDKDCGLPEAGRLVLSRHAEQMLTALLESMDQDRDVTDQYMTVKTKGIRVSDWSLLDLRPAKEERQEEIPGT